MSSIKERHSTKNPITHLSFYEISNMADVHITEPVLITKYKPPLNIEFATDDMPTMYKTDINPYKLKKYIAFEEDDCPFKEDKEW